ncbi:MATE family efflux transporter [Maritimibacter sp. 55A14]|uniref:MATE family efflux transporter n=1 Tax=Maritimibacter sp. 55A14 TaxID=2174844 RepID=UPI000D603538|nr:MATE family efflux transporter [Maritimibacter sp. 55A14]PWE30477.1 MATE family efflux transporter [Maritimibacter sp. 55A14]
MAQSPGIQSWGGHFRATMTLGLPLIGSHLAQVAIQLTDTLMLGWYGVEALAAVVLGASLFMVLFFVGSGFAWAVMPMVAGAAAEGDTRELRRATRMGMWLSVCYGLGAMVPMLWSDPLLVAAGQEPVLADMAQDYLRIAGWGMIPALLVMVLKSYLSALEAARMVLWSTVAAAVLNALVNYALIFGNWGAPELGIRGAAIGAIVSQVAPFLILAVYVTHARVTRGHHIFARLWRADWEAFGRVFRLGWPIGLTTLAEAGLFAASAVMMGWIGTRPLAAHGIAIELTSVSFMVHMGLSQVATVRAGRALARRDIAGLRRAAAMAAGCSAGFALVTVALFLAVPEFLMGLFLEAGDPETPEIVAIGVGLLAVAALFQLADGGQVVALGLLRGVRDTRVPMWLASFSYWIVGLPVAWALGIALGLGGVGVWLGLVVGLALAAVTLSLRFLRNLGRIADRLPAEEPA